MHLLFFFLFFSACVSTWNKMTKRCCHFWCVSVGRFLHLSKLQFPHLQHDGWGLSQDPPYGLLGAFCEDVACFLKCLLEASYYYDYDSWLRAVFSFKDWDLSPWKTGISMSFLLVWGDWVGMREGDREPLSASGWAPESWGIESSGALPDLMWWSSWWGASLHWQPPQCLASLHGVTCCLTRRMCLVCDIAAVGSESCFTTDWMGGFGWTLEPLWNGDHPKSLPSRVNARSKWEKA